jgi:hypothetical protein
VELEAQTGGWLAWLDAGARAAGLLQRGQRLCVWKVDGPAGMARALCPCRPLTPAWGLRCQGRSPLRAPYSAILQVWSVQVLHFEESAGGALRIMWAGMPWWREARTTGRPRPLAADPTLPQAAFPLQCPTDPPPPTPHPATKRSSSTSFCSVAAPSPAFGSCARPPAAPSTPRCAPHGGLSAPRRRRRCCRRSGRWGAASALTWERERRRRAWHDLARCRAVRSRAQLYAAGHATRAPCQGMGQPLQ